MTLSRLKKRTWILACILTAVFLISGAFPQAAEAYIYRSSGSGVTAHWISRSQPSGSSSLTPSQTSQPSQPAQPDPSPPPEPPQPSPAPAPQQPSGQGSTGSSYGIAFSSGYHSQTRTIYRPAPQPAPSPPPASPDPAPAPSPPSPAPSLPGSGSVSLNQQEQQLLNLVNNERNRRGLAPLRVDNRLNHLARLKSQDMIDNRYFAHESPVYGRVGDMLRSAGIGFTLAAENLGVGGSINSIFSAFMASPSHRSKIIDSRYTHTGIGVIHQPGRGYLVTQIFLLPR